MHNKNPINHDKINRKEFSSGFSKGLYLILYLGFKLYCKNIKLCILSKFLNMNY